MNLLETLSEVSGVHPDVLSKVPPEAWEGIGRTIISIISGDVSAAEREARVTAETVAAKLVIDAAYEAGAKEHKP